MVFRILLTFAALYLVAVGLAWKFQKSFLYFPSSQGGSEAFSLWTEGDEIYGYARIPAAPKQVWLFLHGNGGEAAGRGYTLSKFAPEDAVYFLEYPGYGPRKGTPSEESINEAARKAYAWLHARYPNQPLGVIGESLGTGPACVLSKETPTPAKIILLVPFDNLPAVAADGMPWLPARWLLRDRWDNVAALSGYEGELRIYAAESDTVIPNIHAKTLASAFPNALFELFPGGHNDWSFADRISLHWDRPIKRR